MAIFWLKQENSFFEGLNSVQKSINKRINLLVYLSVKVMI